MRKLAVSLFSGAGIGDTGFRAAGFDFISMCELEPERAALAKLNFPSSRVFASGVEETHAEIVAHAKQYPAGDELFLLTCTAPCQGMSKSGQGTLRKNIRAGHRPALDPRNRLILPALDVIHELRPLWAVFENVIEMRNTMIEDGDRGLRHILDIVFDRLSPEYDGQAFDVEMADYGIPQRRQRLITVMTRDPGAREAFRSGSPLVPLATHAKVATRTLKKWVSVMDAIGDFTPLDGRNDHSASDPKIPFHRVPILDPKKYEWIRHTAPGRSAFDSQCIQPGCGFQGNRTHGASHNEDGINRAHRDTPLYCQRCQALLPRPYTETEKGIRLMSGYTSAYKRMDADLPAPALTRNLSYPCSDQKLHPTQNRVLSLAEAMKIHSLDRYDFKWGPLEFEAGGGRRKKKMEIAPDSLIRLVIGESVPPFFLELLGKHILTFTDPTPEKRQHRRFVQRTLW
ncbi:MAG: DNA cytosine methyltransferase [Gemmataceae bacterium]|nr:DNA cytosine methyltransferase [Gemmataceae bacterium]